MLQRKSQKEHRKRTCKEALVSGKEVAEEDTKRTQKKEACKEALVSGKDQWGWGGGPSTNY